MKTTTHKSTRPGPTSHEPSLGMHSILQVLKKDHDDLRLMIEILKSEKKDYQSKKKVYADFSELLKSHAKSEEKAVYDLVLKIPTLKMATLEAFEEHSIADSLMLKLSRTKDQSQWLGRVKVLAELVEHHIIEEENTYLKDVKKQIEAESEQKMIKKFVHLREISPHHPSDSKDGILVALMH